MLLHPCGEVVAVLLLGEGSCVGGKEDHGKQYKASHSGCVACLQGAEEKKRREGLLLCGVERVMEEGDIKFLGWVRNATPRYRCENSSVDSTSPSRCNIYNVIMKYIIEIANEYDTM